MLIETWELTSSLSKSCRWGCRWNSSAVVRSRGTGLADRLRKCRQSPARAIGGAQPRVCHPLSARSESRSRRTAVAYGKRASFPAGGGLGLAVCNLGGEVDTRDDAGNLTSQRRNSFESSCASFCVRRCLAVGVLFRTRPCTEDLESDLQEALKEGGRTSSNSAQHRAQNTLVVVEMALTLVLLVGAGLLFRTIRHLWNVNPGFDTQHIITFKVGVSPSLRGQPRTLELPINN